MPVTSSMRNRSTRMGKDRNAALAAPSVVRLLSGYRAMLAAKTHLLDPHPFLPTPLQRLLLLEL